VSRRRRRFVVLALTGVVAATVLVGCQGSTSAEKSDVGTSNTDPSVTEQGVTRNLDDFFSTPMTFHTGCVAREPGRFLCSVQYRNGEGQAVATALFDVTCDSRTCVYNGTVDGPAKPSAFSGSFPLR
jgi:hypothetical protein